MSYVFKPAALDSFVSSPKYAPLESLPSQHLPPVNLPMDAVYKPTWQYSHQVQPVDKMALPG